MEEKEIREFQRRLRKIINDKKIPPEILQMAEFVYSEYEEIYQKLIKTYKMVYFEESNENKERKKNLDSIIIINKCINKDYEEDKESTKTVAVMGYAIKKEEMDKLLNIIVRKMEENNEYAQNEEYEKDIEAMNTKKENFLFTNTIKNSVTSEINTSKTVLLKKLEGLDDRFLSQEEKYAIRHATNVFESDLNLIINKAIMELQKIEGVLYEDDQEFFEQIKTIVKEYIGEKEKTFEENREKFKMELKENINIDNVGFDLEKQQKGNENKEKFVESLPDNVIE